MKKSIHWQNAIIPIVLFFGLGWLLTACGPTASLDDRLQTVIEAQNLAPFDPGPTPDPALVTLGQALFFDKILSGNKDISCATCHHPTHNTGDSLPVSIGTGGHGLGNLRQLGDGRTLIPRNAPEIFNRGAGEWTTMFWDSRVGLDEDGSFISPAGNRLPDGLDSVLAVQAMFPVTSRDEMRGARGDMDVNGRPNEMAEINDENFPAMWDSLMARLLAHPEYVALFQAAYPDVPLSELNFAHAANAIAAFEADAFTLTNSPWLQYLNGNDNALTPEAKQGALLFYEEAGCAACHSGSLMTDQRTHVLAVPQLGPGKDPESQQDYGRLGISGDSADKYAFRTPPLHNVAVTGPWMHDGAFRTLEAAIQHHLDPAQSLQGYDAVENLPEFMQTAVLNDADLIAEMLHYVDPLLPQDKTLSATERAQLIAFLESLTDPAMLTLADTVPDSVPSGLPVED